MQRILALCAKVTGNLIEIIYSSLVGGISRWLGCIRSTVRHFAFSALIYARGGKVEYEVDHAHHPMAALFKIYWPWQGKTKEKVDQGVDQILQTLHATKAGQFNLELTREGKVGSHFYDAVSQDPCSRGL
jgi:hypothetical protein